MAGLCVQALSSLAGFCGWALCPGLVLLFSSVAGLCGSALCPGFVLPGSRPCSPPPASSGHVFEPCGSSWCSPLSSCHGRKPRVLLLLFVQVCLSTLWALLSPSYPGLSPALATPFFLSPPPVWVCSHVAMNATVTQRSKCDITIGSSHDIYPVSHRFAHVTQASGTGVFNHLLFRRSSQTAGGFRKVYLHSFPPTLEFSELTPTPTKMLTLFGVYAGVITCKNQGFLILVDLQPREPHRSNPARKQCWRFDFSLRCREVIFIWPWFPGESLRSRILVGFFFSCIWTV